MKSKYIQRWQNEDPPLLCKLTDFGEGRSLLIQTNSMLASKVKHVDRGTPAFMSPELLIPTLRPADATMQDLMEADIWALGVIRYVLANPDIAYPYYAAIEARKPSAPCSNPHEIKELLMQQKGPLKISRSHAVFSITTACFDGNLNTMPELDSSKACLDGNLNTMPELDSSKESRACFDGNLNIMPELEQEATRA
eukprot:gene20952-23002_t